MKPQHPHARRRRAIGAMVGIALLMGVLAAAFFRVQVLRSMTYKLRSESNRLRPLRVPAPRGTIFDRNGRVIADNVPGYAVTVLPAGGRDSTMAVVERLRAFIPGLDASDVAGLRRTLDRYPRQPLLVMADAGFDAASALQERLGEFPEVHIEMRPKRRYVSGRAVSHVVGYIGEITREELGTAAFLRERYEQGMIVGEAGIERQYEYVLQGEPGVRYLEVDARGRVVGDFRGGPSRPAVPGNDIRLAIDLELQEWIHRIFPDSMMGAVVAIDPADGGVLALYSAPTFDPNAFVGGIDPKLWRQLNTDENKPLYNRAVLGLYAPASTWKLASAAIALDVGAVTPTEYMPLPCTGGMSYGGRYWRCWKEDGHGYLDLAGAIQHSCDVYFYQLGIKVGLDRLLQEATRIGFSGKAGIDLPQENAGIFPANRQFWTRQFGYSPQESEVLSLAIGQGPNSQTPLKMAQFYTALARDGSAPAPRLFRGADEDAEPEGWALDLREEHLDALRQGLRQVMGPGGTAYMSTVEHWDIMGKTGTGQNALSLQGLAEDHAWFAAIAGPRGGAPEVVVVVLVEYGGSGSGTAAPIAAKSADFYLRRKYGLPIDTVQTLREHLVTRGWPQWAAR